MDRWFNRLPRLVQIILLLIPGVNWVMEVGVRWCKFAHEGGFIRLIIALVVTIGGFFIGWLDAIWCLIFHHMLFA
jgi:preprotein translocase subunit SecY